MSDRIFLQGLRVRGVVGVHEHELLAPRELRVDLELALDLSAAGASDALADTVDYDRLAALARELAAERHHALIEHYAQRLAMSALAMDTRIDAVTVTVHKPGAVSATESVGVRLHRRREDRR